MKRNLQPVKLLVMSEFEDELIHDSVYAYGTTDELQRSVG